MPWPTERVRAYGNTLLECSRCFVGSPISQWVQHVESPFRSAPMRQAHAAIVDQLASGILTREGVEKARHDIELLNAISTSKKRKHEHG